MSPLWDTGRPKCPCVSSGRLTSTPICPTLFATDCSGDGPRVQNPYAIPGFATNPQPAGRIPPLHTPLL